MADAIQKLLDQTDFEGFYQKYIKITSKTGDELHGLCPFHQDKVSSFSANKKTGLFKCFACGAKGSVFQFIERFKNVNFKEALKIVANFSGVKVESSNSEIPKNRPRLDSKLPQRYLNNLLKNKDTLAFLQEKKGLILPIIKKYELGWNGNRITIPIYDEKKVLRNIRKYNSKKKPKMISASVQKKGEKGRWTYGEGRIYGLGEMLVRLKETVYLHEGEWDRLLASQCGFLAVTGTVGAMTFKDEWRKFFAGRNVVIIYDMDPEGKKGAEVAARALVGVATSVKIVQLPLKGSKDEKDYSDYFLKKGGTTEGIKKLVEETPIFVAPPEEIEEQTKKNKSFIPRIYANKIIKEFSLKYDVSGYFYYYDKKDKIWKFKAHKFLAHWLEMWSGLPIKWKKQGCINEIISSAQRISQIMEIPPQPPISLIPFQNCIVDFETGKKYEFGPDYFFINKLSIPYVPKKIKAPMLDKFLNSIVAEEDMISIIELFGYAMVRSYPYQMSFWLYGGGGNGKTQTCELGKRILGIENVSAVRLETIDRGSFQTANLYGKLMNVSPEIDLQILRRTGIFKQLTGGDPIQFEKKYKDAFVGKNYAKMIFLCNFLPYTFDISPAFFRRIFLIEFIRMFREENDAISDIATKFPQEEVNAFGYCCFQALQALAKRDFRFTRHKAMEERREDYLKKSDPLQIFLDQETKKNYDGKVSSVDFNLRFNEYQKKANVKTLWTSFKIRKVMRDKGYIPQTIRDGDQRYEGYWGFSWIDD